MCDCIEKTESMLTAKMQEEFPGREIIDPVLLQPRFLYTAGYPLCFTAEGHVAFGKGIRKFNAAVILLYCPFCGRKLTENK